MIEDDYPASEWNIYLFHFSDGDNWSGDDTADCMKLLETSLLPTFNLFCYGQVGIPLRLGPVHPRSARAFRRDEPKITTCQIKDRDAIMDATQDFLGKGSKHPSRTEHPTDSRACDELAASISKAVAREGRPRFLRHDLRGGRLQAAERDRRLWRLSHPLSALALWHGIRAPFQELHLRSVR